MENAHSRPGGGGGLATQPRPPEAPHVQHPHPLYPSSSSGNNGGSSGPQPQQQQLLHQHQQQGQQVQPGTQLHQQQHHQHPQHHHQHQSQQHDSPLRILPPINTMSNSTFHSSFPPEHQSAASPRGLASQPPPPPRPISQSPQTPAAHPRWPSQSSEPSISSPTHAQRNPSLPGSSQPSYRYDSSNRPDSPPSVPWNAPSSYFPAQPYSAAAAASTSPTHAYQGHAPLPASYGHHGTTSHPSDVKDFASTGYASTPPPHYSVSGSVASSGQRTHSFASSAGYPHDYASTAPTSTGYASSQSLSPRLPRYSNGFPPPRNPASERDERQAADTLASLQQHGPMSPRMPEARTVGEALKRAPDGRPLVPGQQLLDDRAMDAYTLSKNNQLPPPLSISPTPSNPANRPLNPINTTLAPAYECSGRTGISDAYSNSYWPEPPKPVKRAQESDHYATPTSSPREIELSASKRPKAELQSQAKPKKETAQTGAATFKFIDHKDSDASRQVRQHVMKRHRAMQREEREEQIRKADPGATIGAPRSKKSRRKQDKGDKQLKSEAKEPLSIDAIASYSTTKGQITPDTPGQVFPTLRPSTDGGATPSPQNLSPKSALAPTHKRRQLFMPFEDLTPDSDSERERDALLDEELQKQCPDPRAAVAPAVPDPFNRQLAQLMASGIQISGVDPKKLFHHFMTVMPTLMDEAVTGNQFSRIGWLYSTVSILDPNPVPAILGYTASHIASLHGQSEPEWSVDCKMQAIRLINDRINDPDQQISDSNIGAVLLLLFFELIFCNPQIAATHLEGVRRMIELRPGGYMSIYENSYLRTTILRVETIRAYLAISEHRFYTWKPFKKLPDFVVDVNPLSIYKPSIQAIYENDFCANGLRLFNRTESALLRLDNISNCGVTMDIKGIRKIILSKIQGTLDLDEDPPSQWSWHISRKVLRLGVICMLDLAAKELFDTGKGADSLPPKTFVKDFAKRYLGAKPDERDKAAAWGRTVEMIIYTLLNTSEPMQEKPWRGFYFADALILTSKLTVEQWQGVERALQEYIDNWGWSNPEDTQTSRAYFNIRAVAKDFEQHWDEYMDRQRSNAMSIGDVGGHEFA